MQKIRALLRSMGDDGADLLKSGFLNRWD